MTNTITITLTTLLLGGCLLDETEPQPEPDLSEVENPVINTNKLSANKLSANKLSANKLSANKLSANSLGVTSLMATADGREVLSYIVGCAIASSKTLTFNDPSGVPHSFSGSVGLAPAWETRAPTVSERRWVTACVLARTNAFGIEVPISMRHDSNLALLSTATERAEYTAADGAFYGDLFIPSPGTPVLYACATRDWTAPPQGEPRACALSSNGVTTECGLTYTGKCTNSIPCTDKTAPFGSCKGGSTTYAEVVSIFLKPIDVH